MDFTGLILDGVLMILLVSALAFGVRLSGRLKALREGQQRFAEAVGELNQAAARAEAALRALKAAGEETDLLHDRIVAARTLKGELEGLLARAPRTVERPEMPPARAPASAPPRPAAERAPLRVVSPEPEPSAERSADGVSEARASALAARVLQALAANQSAQDNLNRARARLDDDALTPRRARA
ncbi:MAG: DUF6468 domain-containing protein [Brevundimonas sp.]|uniref:DUF6468 domain-containing protein n=1 Tax=Brevundimonas sp. TaxID=1871086 RepID=UPI00391B980F